VGTEHPRSTDDRAPLREQRDSTMSTETEQLRVQVEPHEDEVVLLLDGELDPHTAPILRQELDALVAVGSTTIVLDMRALRFIDSSGLRVVISAHRELREAGGKLSLRSLSDTARRLLEITGLTDHIEIVENDR
jgi:stage II sporulation protein AA (anti-sigma F factor antagonist)